VFRAKPPWATYLGEFEVDGDTPYVLADSPDADGVVRQVIVFRLRPVGPFVDGGLPTARALPTSSDVAEIAAIEPSDGPTALEVPLEAANVDGYTVTPPDEPIVALRREAGLVLRYQAWLEKRGHSVTRNRITFPGELAALLTDLYDLTDKELVEAKASASRNSVRTGLGQLLDYSRFVRHDRRSLLLPMEPRADLLELLHGHGCGCIWEVSTGTFNRSDP
jgi:hypothetical protein